MDLPEWLRGWVVHDVEKHGFVFIMANPSPCFSSTPYPIEDYWPRWPEHAQTLIMQLSLITGSQNVFAEDKGHFYWDGGGFVRAPHPDA